MNTKLMDLFVKYMEKQEILSKLTADGQFLYDEHKERYDLWLKSDDAFIKQFDKETVTIVENFMLAFNVQISVDLHADSVCNCMPISERSAQHSALTA